MSAREHERYRDDVAAYALGALEEDEAVSLRRHLETCGECRQQLRWLQPAVELLPRAVAQVEAPSRLRKRLLATVRAESRHAAGADVGRGGRSALGALLLRPATTLAAATLVAAGAVGGYLLHQPGGGPSVVAVRGTSSAPRASGTLARQGGSAVLHVQGMPSLARDQVYEAWIRLHGAVQPSSLFVVRPDGSGDAAITGSLYGADAVLVTREPRGGSRHPTSPPVLEAKLG